MPQRANRLNWHTLFAAFALLTVLSATAYFGLSLLRGPEEIASQCRAFKGPYTACLAGESLYLSIATETTVGYGDLKPQGWARVVACVQALIGLMIAGLFLGKIGSLPTRATRQLVEKCTGYWIEFSEPRRDTMISFVTISYKDSLIHYCGDNYGILGGKLKSFSGHIEPSYLTLSSKVAFWYSNKEDFNDFYEGTTTLRFVEENNIAKRFTRFTGFADDTRHGTIKMCGYRVLKADEPRFLSEDDAVKRGVMLEYLKAYEADTKPEVLDVLAERLKRA